MSNLAEMFFQTVRSHPTDPAVTFEDTTLSWGELCARVLALRATLRGADIGPGDIVAIYSDHDLSQVVAILATAACDAAFQVVNPALRKDQILHQLSDSDACAIIGHQTHLARVEDLVQNRRLKAIAVDALGRLPEGELEGAKESSIESIEFPTTRNIPADVAHIIYTSGSTGKSKGVVVPHRSLLDGARIVSGYLEISARDVILSILPFSFDYGLNQLLTCVYTGARIVLHTFVLPKEFLGILHRERVTGLAGVPSLWPSLFNPKLVDQTAGHDLESLRYVTTAGGPHGEKLLRDLHAFLPHSEIIIMYGLTESFRSTYLPFSELFRRIGSIGKAVPEVEILVVNTQGERCAVGEKGELIHRGAFISYGYLNDAELTASKFIELPTGGPGCRGERAVRSGDIVSLDADGFIYFHGRADAQIKSFGYRISPAEVEEAAMSFPGIQQAGAYGAPDPRSGQMVCLAYSPHGGRDVKEAGLLAHLRKHLPNYAVPGLLQRYDRLPLTPNGKVDYPALAAAGSSSPSA